jgi:hypothetical protein
VIVDLDVSLRDLGPYDVVAHGEGAQGAVHALRSFRLPSIDGDLMLKLYEARDASPVPLRALARWRYDLSPGDRAVVDGSTAWPLQVVVEGGCAVGVVMRAAPPFFVHEVKGPVGTVHRLREAQWLFRPDHRLLRRGVPLVLTRARRAVCASVAALIDLLHRNDVVFGDISARNILYCTEPFVAAFLLDCDSARLRGAASATRQLDSPDWGDPAGGSVQTLASDRYKLSLFIVRALAQSLQARSADTAEALLGPEGYELAVRGLSTVDLDDRTTAAEWVEYLNRPILARGDHRA